jgi:ABC-type glycerol-3-phosphate transport system permease component
VAAHGLSNGDPRDIEEQAMVDGYSRPGAFVRAVVPLTFPGIVAVVAFAASLTASEFICALASTLFLDLFVDRFSAGSTTGAVEG